MQRSRSMPGERVKAVSIPLCNVFTDTYPDAEIILVGVEEPLALIHAPTESVDQRRSRPWR